jgi:hypothetical protein
MDRVFGIQLPAFPIYFLFLVVEQCAEYYVIFVGA